MLAADAASNAAPQPRATGAGNRPPGPARRRTRRRPTDGGDPNPVAEYRARPPAGGANLGTRG